MGDEPTPLIQYLFTPGEFGQLCAGLVIKTETIIGTFDEGSPSERSQYAALVREICGIAMEEIASIRDDKGNNCFSHRDRLSMAQGVYVTALQIVVADNIEELRRNKIALLKIIEGIRKCKISFLCRKPKDLCEKDCKKR